MVAFPVAASTASHAINRPGRASPVGATSGDVYQGEWRDADVYFQPYQKSWTYTFRHVNLKEFPDLKDFNAEYRTTMRLRLLFDGAAPKIEKIEASPIRCGAPLGFGDRTGQRPEEADSGRGFEVFNG